MGNLIRQNNPKLASEGSNRLEQTAENYPDPGFKADFECCESLEQISECLLRMDKVGLHLVGSRGYVYSSLRMAEIVMEVARSGSLLPLSLLTRAGNLRATVIKLLIEEN